jgi:sulfur-oxidizing protein SoxY
MMAEKSTGRKVGRLSRRRLLAAAAASGATMVIGHAARAEETHRTSGGQLLSFGQTFRVAADREEAERIVRGIIGDRTPREGLVRLTAPDIAEDGATVPFTIEVESAMTEEDYPALVHLVALENPFPELARFRFTPACGEAAVTGRCRMRASAPLVAVAEMSDGSVGKAEKFVDVVLGGCD